MRKGRNERSESFVGAAAKKKAFFHQPKLQYMYRSIKFEWDADSWEVLLPESPRAQKFARVIKKVEVSIILRYLLARWADRLKITVFFEPIEIK